MLCRVQWFDMPSIKQAAKDLGMRHAQIPMVAFKRDDLGEYLPDVVARIYQAIHETPGVAYFHCNGGEFT